MSVRAAVLDPSILGPGVGVRERSIDRFAMAHDASHYLLVPDVVLTPETAEDVARIFRASSEGNHPVTFRSGGTSLSGQGVTGNVLVDTRSRFQRITVEQAGRRLRVQPGATVRQCNAHLLRHGRKLGPDPASEIACTIGGVVANNSSGMACGIEQNTYRTLESMVFVLPSGTIIDTADVGADAALERLEPALYSGLQRLHERVNSNPASLSEIKRLYSMKNTMGYGLNSFTDFERPIDILTHLIIGSEGTLAFVAEATFRTVEVLPHAATGLLVFESLRDATRALPALLATGLATIELMDAQSLRVAQRAHDCPQEVAELSITTHAALLIEFQAHRVDELEHKATDAAQVFAALPLTRAPVLSTDAGVRSALWHTRKGLYTAVAGARPSGTTALLEDIVVPVTELLPVCEALARMFDEHGYENSVIFGHAKDGNIHFMLNECFDDPIQLARYERFTAELVELVLSHGGSLKAEHGTGRIMAPFVRRQYGGELYEVMWAVKSLCDPAGILNPGVLLSDDPRSYLADLKLVPTVEKEVDRCVECGYCEPACPSKNLTLTPRQRIVLRREMKVAEDAGDSALLAELRDDYEYDGIETCAVDGMCKVACPVDINTGDLVRRLRQESRNAVEQKAWRALSSTWGAFSRVGGLAMEVAHALPAAFPVAATTVGRALLGHETVPLYDDGLPGGGSRRPRPVPTTATTDVVFFSACITTLFGPAEGSLGVSRAFLELCERADLTWAVPDGISSMCCGTPWKSKGFSAGYEHMSSVVLPALLTASDGGRIPIVCDAASCTEGLLTMQQLAIRAGGDFAALRFVDAVEFVYERVLPGIRITSTVPRMTVHTTCSTSQLGINDAMLAIANAVAYDVRVPIDWGCCAFAGDRGLLHPELTASATRAEAAEVMAGEFNAYVSANRTCEIGMSRATGHEYRHLLEVLEEATRPST
ncbi:D-lactate dehydrogenase [Arthrobacter pigmenti]|uniref:D-lactate dehydrogenase (cytochrome) n=1 Tax=Arthrobacter pigmenti TaxID=271432 RepID=A0A846RV67_9MICC|nr:FAD-binding and (Fe-S)-binding domain-containing protein [Arthrobacter pigmenti]NJC24474.1 D-lactate dehydrogenase [Arthrobacter pigmenti]